MSLPARWSAIKPTDLDPKPIEQLPRRALPPHTKSVAAETKWACPGHHTDDWIARAAAVCEYAVWLAGRPDVVRAAHLELAGADLACTCPLGSRPCHRDVLLDAANPPANPSTSQGRAIGLTVRRPWASLILVPEQLGGKPIDTRTWSTDYRGPIAIFAGARIDERGHRVAIAHDLDAGWHRKQTGWLGAAVLVDIHRVHCGCCEADPPGWRGQARLYHWVFTSPARLARRRPGRGFVGLRPVSWSVLLPARRCADAAT